jgi:hypothetical protein
VILSKNVFVRGVFFVKITADAVVATLCRRARRNGVMKNSRTVGSQIFYSHADCAEVAEAHRLLVLTMRDVCVRPFWGGGPT